MRPTLARTLLTGEARPTDLIRVTLPDAESVHVEVMPGAVAGAALTSGVSGARPFGVVEGRSCLS